MDGFCMKMFGLLPAFFILVLAVAPKETYGTPYASQQGSKIPTCDDPENGGLKLSLTLDDEKDYVSFKCSSNGDPAIEPSPVESRFYKGPDCTTPADLHTEAPGAVLLTSPKAGVAHSIPTTYTLKMASEDRKPVELCYVCKLPKDASEHGAVLHNRVIQKTQDCQVHIAVKARQKTEVPEQPESEDKHDEENKDPTGVTVCSDGIHAATASPETPLTFRCGAAMAIQPKSPKDVFEIADNNCGKEVPLASMLDATLEERAPSSGEYTLTVNKAAAHNTAFCYKCVKPSPLTHKGSAQSSLGAEAIGKECVLKVSVAGVSESAVSVSSMSKAFALIAGSAALEFVYAFV
ncbi:hypothetical protein BESB_033740 [Besnoitia besnoiti]|uniref:SRS domain-containing protein n=1 Tax=Besnoitia besnoiti TaxID=94643 RepID=A0A2A9MLK4_BESBE|nr:hypothetical protein BESB_033740 [Besnoitia besnoiti]PFH36916.1 hypothetical protein BESB_033740 [Besnoitia besnoiti]